MTGEPCNGKLLRTVRRGAHGKGLLVSTSPGAYPTAIPSWGGRYRFEHLEHGVYPFTSELPVDRDGLYWSLLDSFAEQECGDVLRNRSRTSLQGCQALIFV
jgi:hypothetical protein